MDNLSKIFLKSVERRTRKDGEDFAICRFATLKGGANRISNEPDVAEALEGTWVEGEIIRADVKPYKNDFEDGKGEQTLKVRNVVVYKGETIEAATIASGHELARKPKAVLAEAGADADQE